MFSLSANVAMLSIIIFYADIGYTAITYHTS